MAINKEALTYLQELELNPDWTKIPDSDRRIIKLRELFYSDERKIKGVHQKGYGKKLKVIVGNTPILFESVAKCSIALGLSKYSIYSALKNGTKLKGMLFEEVGV